MKGASAGMVYRVYVEKKEALANEARALLEDLREFLGIRSLTGIRLLNRYDLENISRELFRKNCAFRAAARYREL